MAKTSARGPKSRGGDASKAKRPESESGGDWSEQAFRRNGIVLSTAEAREWLRKKRITPADVRDIGGGGFDNSIIEVKKSADGVVIGAQHDKLSGATRKIGQDDNGRLYIYNSYFRVAEGRTGGGIGRRMLQRQVLAARRLGISKIKTDAAGELGGSFNGYYSWASLGYNGRVPDSFRKRYSGTAIGRAKTTQELFSIRGGSEAWKAHGTGVSMTFTVRRGSVGWKMLFEGRKRFE